MKKTQGSITVFLALVFLSILLVLITLLESVRIRAAQVYYQMALDSSVDSVAAGYCRELFDEYGLFFYWPDQMSPEEEVKKYLSYYEDPYQETLYSGINLYSLDSGRISMQEVRRAGDCHGKALREQMLSAIGYDLAEEAVSALIGQNALAESGDACRTQMEQIRNTYLETDWHALFTQDASTEAEESTDSAEPTETEEPTDSAEPTEMEESADSEDQTGSEKPANADNRQAWQERWDTAWDESLADQLLKWLENPVLQMVLPEGTVVSGIKVTPEEMKIDFPESEEGMEPVLASQLVEKVLLNEYVLMHTASFMETVSDRGLRYQTEYALCGNLSDEENLSDTINRILLLREGMNLLWLLQDSDSMASMTMLAEAVVGWTGLPVLVTCVKFVLLAAWAYAEAIVDVRRLLEGKVIPLQKTQDTWAVSLERIPDLITGTVWEYETEQVGLDYKAYLRLLLFLQPEKTNVERMAGIIQQQMYNRNRMFSLRDCISEAEFVLDATLSRGNFWAAAWPDEIRSFRLEQRMKYEKR